MTETQEYPVLSSGYRHIKSSKAVKLPVQRHAPTHSQRGVTWDCLALGGGETATSPLRWATLGDCLSGKLVVVPFSSWPKFIMLQAGVSPSLFTPESWWKYWLGFYTAVMASFLLKGRYVMLHHITYVICYVDELYSAPQVQYLLSNKAYCNARWLCAKFGPGDGNVLQKY